MNASRLSRDTTACLLTLTIPLRDCAPGSVSGSGCGPVGAPLDRGRQGLEGAGLVALQGLPRQSSSPDLAPGQRAALPTKSNQGLQTWVELAENYWRQFVWSPYHARAGTRPAASCD